MAFVLQAQEISLTYRDEGKDLAAFGPLSLGIVEGEFISVVGPTGCGKSSLLRVLSGLVLPSTGQVLLGCEPLAGPQVQIGVIFQQPTLFPWLTVRDNIGFAATYANGVWDNVDKMIGLVGLSEYSAFFPRALSGGMVQKAILARALIAGPRILVLDEPFTSLDGITRELMQELLINLCKKAGISMVFVTHDLDEALLIGDRVMLLSPRPGRPLHELTVTLPRPRVVSGMRCAGYSDLRNELGQLAFKYYRA